MKHLTREELKERYSSAKKVKHESTRKVAHQSALVNKMVDEKGANVAEDQHELLKNLIENHELKNLMKIPPSLCYGTKKKNFHPKSIQELCHPSRCLSIYHSSPAAYRQLSNKILGF